MANKFVPWIDTTSTSTIGVSTQSQEAFAQDEQRKVGFVAGNPASAIRVNSALRQANVVVAALMQLADELATLPDLDLNSSVADITAALKASIITPIESHLSDLDDEVAALSGGSSTLVDRVSTLESEMNTAQRDINNAENRLDELEAYYKRDITTSNWSGSAGNYTFSIAATTHGRGTRPRVHTYVNGEETYDSPTINWSTGSVTLHSNARVAMKVLIY